MHINSLQFANICVSTAKSCWGYQNISSAPTLLFALRSGVWNVELNILRSIDWWQRVTSPWQTERNGRTEPFPNKKLVVCFWCTATFKEQKALILDVHYCLLCHILLHWILWLNSGAMARCDPLTYSRWYSWRQQGCTPRSGNVSYITVCEIYNENWGDYLPHLVKRQLKSLKCLHTL